MSDLMTIEMRELTAWEVEEVSGGMAPVVVAALITGAAIIISTLMVSQSSESQKQSQTCNCVCSTP